MIARCADPQQVASAVRFAREAGLEISVRERGYNYAGTAVGDGGLMVHSARTNQVSVDPASRRGQCGGGATWGDLDAATQSNGLANSGRDHRPHRGSRNANAERATRIGDDQSADYRDRAEKDRNPDEKA